jgi:phage gp36-like protein
MEFLTDNDFQKQIQEDILDRVIDDDDSILYSAELATIAEMQSYLRARYDVVNIYNKIGTQRNALIVMYSVDILLYHIHSRIAPEQIPDIRLQRYERAIEWLKMVSNGELSPDLPLLQVGDSPVQVSVVVKSDTKQNWDF